jgi:hypothetical protein
MEGEMPGKKEREMDFGKALSRIRKLEVVI